MWLESYSEEQCDFVKDVIDGHRNDESANPWLQKSAPVYKRVSWESNWLNAPMYKRSMAVALDLLGMDLDAKE